MRKVLSLVEWMDISTLLTIVNVVLVIAGWHYAPLFGLVNAGAGLVVAKRAAAHINTYLMNTALIILNIYFLNL